MFYRLNHGHFAPIVKVDFRVAVRQFARAQHLVRAVTEKLLRNFHHAVVVNIRLIQLDSGKFRIVPNIHTLVSEKPPYFIHLFKAADYQTLEIQLRRYSHIHIDIQRVVVRHKGARVCTAGYGIEHRRFHFYISESVEILADTADDLERMTNVRLTSGLAMRSTYLCL